MYESLKNNGFIIKSYEEQFFSESFKNYIGIGRYTTWPLDSLNDSISQNLTNEAYDKWFGYQDNRLWTVPDLDYLKRYMRHCKNLGISVFCLQIESDNDTMVSSVKLPIVRVLGFDYSDCDMVTSCMYDDFTMSNDIVKSRLKKISEKLNEFGLFNSKQDVIEYIQERNFLIELGIDMEEYFSPTIIKISEVRCV